jgi:hypothetical protein
MACDSHVYASDAIPLLLPRTLRLLLRVIARGAARRGDPRRDGIDAAQHPKAAERTGAYHGDRCTFAQRVGVRDYRVRWRARYRVHCGFVAVIGS